MEQLLLARTMKEFIYIGFPAQSSNFSCQTLRDCLCTPDAFHISNSIRYFWASVCVWTIWKDVKLLTCLMMCFNGFPIWHCLFGFFIWFSNKSRGARPSVTTLPCPTKLCHWRGSNWGRPVVYLQIVFNCWTRCPLRCYSFSGRILLHCFSRLVIHHLLSGLLECFLHVRCIPHQ